MQLKANVMRENTEDAGPTMNHVNWNDLPSVSIQSEHPKLFELSNNEVQENTPFMPESALNPVDVSALDQEQY